MFTKVKLFNQDVSRLFNTWKLNDGEAFQSDEVSFLS
jgi:hypothetical protein